jgi:hypothetical protein
MSIIDDVIETMKYLPEAHQREVLTLARDLQRHAEEQSRPQNRNSGPHNSADAPDPELVDREATLGHS